LSYYSYSPATLEFISLLLSNLLLTESESEATFIPNSAELIIVLELNVLSDASVLTSIPFDLEFMMSGNAKMCSNNYTLLIFANGKISQQKLLMLPNYQFSYHSLYYRSNY
jgi:hypothetical protein